MPKIGILERLAPEQKEQLLTWLELYPRKEVLERLAAPPPAGFGVRTHLASLRRFEQAMQVESKCDCLALARNLAHSADDLALIKLGATSSLAQTALALAASSDPVSVSAGAKLVAALKRDDFLEQKLAIQRERLALEREDRLEKRQMRQQEIRIDEARLEIERLKASAVLPAPGPASDSPQHLDRQLEEQVKRVYGDNAINLDR